MRDLSGESSLSSFLVFVVLRAARGLNPFESV